MIEEFFPNFEQPENEELPNEANGQTTESDSSGKYEMPPNTDTQTSSVDITTLMPARRGKKREEQQTKSTDLIDITTLRKSHRNKRQQ